MATALVAVQQFDDRTAGGRKGRYARARCGATDVCIYNRNRSGKHLVMVNPAKLLTELDSRLEVELRPEQLQDLIEALTAARNHAVEAGILPARPWS